MADYKRLYDKAINTIEQAMELLIKAQRECEEIYINSEADEVNEEKTNSGF